MQHFLSFEQIEQRAEAIGLKRKVLCARAGVDASSYWRYGQGVQRQLSTTLERLSAALVAIEREYLEHLIALHPQHAASLLAGGRSQGETGGVGGSPVSARPAGTPAEGGEAPLRPAAVEAPAGRQGIGGQAA